MQLTLRKLEVSFVPTGKVRTSILTATLPSSTPQLMRVSWLKENVLNVKTTSMTSMTSLHHRNRNRAWKCKHPKLRTHLLTLVKIVIISPLSHQQISNFNNLKQSRIITIRCPRRARPKIPCLRSLSKMCLPLSRFVPTLKRRSLRWSLITRPSVSWTGTLPIKSIDTVLPTGPEKSSAPAVLKRLHNCAKVLTI
jgi:hypothetical protein